MQQRYHTEKHTANQGMGERERREEGDKDRQGV
jgi:hypothetical protein